jgi:hypothetical protein
MEVSFYRMAPQLLPMELLPYQETNISREVGGTLVWIIMNSIGLVSLVMYGIEIGNLFSSQPGTISI